MGRGLGVGRRGLCAGGGAKEGSRAVIWEQRR